MTTIRRRVRMAGLCSALTFCIALLTVSAQQGAPQGYIGGVVQGPSGPEAGVWVIAETKDTPTPLIKIVVTDDRGRFMLPELPPVSYQVWVRGYGLVDSPKQTMKPGAASVTLRAEAAKTPQEAAKVYPGDYWLSLLEPPAASAFPGTGPQGNGLGAGLETQAHWINSLKSNCNFCHQLGNEITRSVDHVLKMKPELRTAHAAWEWRLGTGVRGNNMYSVLTTMGKDPALAMFTSWSDRIAKGEVPPAPPRPTGVERNVVLTLWDWGTDQQEPADGQRRRARLCRVGGPRDAGDRQPAHEQRRRDRDPDAGAARQRPVTLPEADPAVALVRRRAPVGQSAVQPLGPAQRHARQQGPGLDDVEDPAQPGPGLVQ